MTNEILSKYQTSKNGLGESEVRKRQEKYGPNKLLEQKPKSPVFLFFEQFVDVLIALLIIAAIAAYAIGDVIDAGVIILAILLNVIMGFIDDFPNSIKSFGLTNPTVSVINRFKRFKEI